MKHLPAAILLAGIFLALVLLWRAARSSSLSLATPSPAREFAAAAPPGASSPANALSPPNEPSGSHASLANEITRALRDGSAEERDRAFNELLPRLIALDPASAGHLALAWDQGGLRDEFLRHVIRLWSAADIGGVVTWLASLLESTDRDLAAKASTAQVAQSDRAGALDLAQALRVGLDDGSLEHLAQLWTEEHPDEAVAWIVRQPTSPGRDRLLARIAHVRSQQHPAEAVRLVLEHLPAGEPRDEALVAVVRNWAARDPAEAEAWVAAHPAGSLQSRALAEIERARRLR